MRFGVFYELSVPRPWTAALFHFTQDVLQPETEEPRAEARRDADFVGNTGAQEDRAVVEKIQRGLSSGANDAFIFGKYESALVHFHRTLTAALA